MPTNQSLAAAFYARCEGPSWRDLLQEQWEPSYIRVVRQYMECRPPKRVGPSRRAIQRARALLHRSLDRQQRRELRGTKAFTMVGKDGKTYRIAEKASTNVTLLDKTGKPVKRLCVVFKDTGLPIYDLMLAQKLLLESNPKDFWKIARVSAIDPEPSALNPRIDLRARWAAAQMNMLYRAFQPMV